MSSDRLIQKNMIPQIPERQKKCEDCATLASFLKPDDIEAQAMGCFRHSCGIRKSWNDSIYSEADNDDARKVADFCTEQIEVSDGNQAQELSTRLLASTSHHYIAKIQAMSDDATPTLEADLESTISPCSINSLAVGTLPTQTRKLSVDISSHSADANGDGIAISTVEHIKKNDQIEDFEGTETKTIKSATEIKPIFKITKMKKTDAVKQLSHSRLRHRMTKDEHAVLEAAFDPFKEWDKTKMTELAKRLDIST